MGAGSRDGAPHPLHATVPQSSSTGTHGIDPVRAELYAHPIAYGVVRDNPVAMAAYRLVYSSTVVERILELVRHRRQPTFGQASGLC